jgi:hypothetical protein
MWLPSIVYFSLKTVSLLMFCNLVDVIIYDCSWNDGGQNRPENDTEVNNDLCAEVKAQ